MGRGDGEGGHKHLSKDLVVQWKLKRMEIVLVCQNDAITNFPLHFERSLTLEEILPENYKKEAMKLEHLLQARKSPSNITGRCG